MKKILIDTGYFKALFDRNDQYHSQAISLAQLGFKLYCPYPVTFESLTSRYSTIECAIQLRQLINRNSILFTNNYNLELYTLTNLQWLENNISNKRLSFTDVFILEYLEVVRRDSPLFRFDYLFTVDYDLAGMAYSKFKLQNILHSDIDFFT